MVKSFSRFALLSLFTVAALAACGDDAPTVADQQTDVLEAGAELMPFDLGKTKHSFTKTDDGGIHTVVAFDPADVEQVRLVREHLEEVSVEVAAGRFEDPATIHGEDMPGVQELAAGAADLEITYREVDAGGEITYATTEGAMVGCLHDWFDAQAADHGTDAVSEPYGHVTTEEMWRSHYPGQPYSGSTPED